MATQMTFLSAAEIEACFLRAVTSYANTKQRWRQRAETGLTDQELRDALTYELGIHGGSGCRDSISIAYQGAGLKIWANRGRLNHCTDVPILQGQQTMAMERSIFGIANPDDQQMSLF
jgi:hypothetical protein